ncbi:hypothetical protein B0H14DRAFT_2619968 [Mycena olivaceomarginata]|nr:hypothetical protein B0H14DRAFT_2619968 [Mycena olivaceomarginata]
MTTLDTECDWKEREERDREATTEDGHKSESETWECPWRAGDLGLDEWASLHKATVLHYKRGGWARIAAGMVGGGREEENGSAADASVERYKSAEMGEVRVG